MSRQSGHRPSLNMTWDTRVTMVTLAGGAVGKVRATLLPDEDGDKTVVVEVDTANFAAGDQVTISGLRCTNFIAASAADSLCREGI